MSNSASSASLVGKIDVTLEVNASDVVTHVSVDNTRPTTINRLFYGKTPEQALKLIPKVFLLCSRAQQAAAIGAIAQTKGETLESEQIQTLAQHCALEWLKEHCWQLWQMQRELFSLDFAMQENLKLNRILLQRLQKLPDIQAENTSTRNNGNIAELGKHLEAMFGMRPDVFCHMTLEEAVSWSEQTYPYAQMLGKVIRNHVAEFGAFDNSDSSADESGSIIRQADSSLVQAATLKWGNGLATRLVARFVEICEVYTNPQIAAPPKAGLAHASRGVLQHKIEWNDDGTITNYQIDAPTDRNFISGGCVESALLGQTLLEQNLIWAKQLIWSIDPCVEFSVRYLRKE